ncbi:MAG TPA: alpha/beta hydrolase [Phycisphaerae bacterium]|nr:alpha/beta hydrolase [Phycisphaerae bacterium]
MDKPTVIMVHGLVGSLRYFDLQARLGRATVVTEDLLGYGRQRDFPPDRLTLAVQAEYVARRIDELPAERVWLLGHSMGGAVAVLAAERRPERLCGLINVEGNFTEKDAFWSRKIVEKQPHEWAEEYRQMQSDPAGWLERCDVEPDPQRTAWARQILEHQPASTVSAMAKAIVAETSCPSYLDTVRRLLDRGLPMHMVAGEKSAADWDVPDFVRTAAASFTEQPAVGHLMMLEDPDGFCEIVAAILSCE